MSTFTSQQTDQALSRYARATVGELGRQAMEWPAAVVGLDLDGNRTHTLNFAAETVVNVVEWLRDLDFTSDQINEALRRANDQANTRATIKTSLD